MPQKRSVGSLRKDVDLSWFDALPICMVILDQNGKFAYVNDTFSQRIQRSKEELIGAPPDQFIQPSESARFVRELLQAFRGVQSEGVTYNFVLPRGLTEKIVFISSPIYGPERREGRSVKYIFFVETQKHV